MLEDYPKAIVTPDGKSVLLRPVAATDEQALREFFCKIPVSEQWFLRERLTDSERLHDWIHKVNHDFILPIVAVREDDGAIIANLRLYRTASESMRHVAHLRIMVLSDCRNYKIGSWMILDCMKLAMDLGIEKLFAEFIAGFEEPAVRAAHKLNFRPEAVLPQYVKDVEGKYHDLIIMVRDLHREWSDF